jgi:RNA polymerase sigma factor (sigma-70 family)
MKDDTLETQIGEMTVLLRQFDNKEIAEEVLRRNFAELRRMATRVLGQRGAWLNIAPSDVYQEFCLHLNSRETGFRNTEHFFGEACMKMKNIVIDRARKMNTTKGGGGIQHVNIDDVRDVLTDFRHNGLGAVDVAAEQLLAIMEVLPTLKSRSQKDSDLFNRYYFAEQSQAEIAEHYNMREDAVKDRLKRIRLWLKQEILRNQILRNQR